MLLPRCGFIIAFIFVICGAAVLRGQGEVSVSILENLFDERELVKLPKSSSPIFFAPNSSIFAYIVKDWRKQHIVFGSYISPNFHEIFAPVFASDGNRMAFGARIGKRYFMVVDGKIGEPYEEPTLINPRFSENGKIIVYYGKQNGKDFVVVNDKKSQLYDWAGWYPAISANGDSVAFPAKRGEKATVVFNGHEGPQWDATWSPKLSRDGTHLAYCARSGAKTFVVIDGIEGPPFQDVGAPSFSPDGQLAAHSADMGNKHLMIFAKLKDQWEPAILYSQEGKTYKELLSGTGYCGATFSSGSIYDGVIRYPVFSPDSQKIAITCKAGCHGFIVLNNIKGPEFSEVDIPIFSANSRSIAYSAKQDDGKYVVIFNGKPSKPFYSVGKIALSANGDQIAYQAAHDKKHEFVMLGTQQGPFFDEITSNLAFSPNGKDVTYCARNGKHWFVVVGQNVSPPYDRVWTPMFNAEGSKLAFAARAGRIIYWKVLSIK
jgi:Tol biopolymer transport system component